MSPEIEASDWTTVHAAGARLVNVEHEWRGR